MSATPQSGRMPLTATFDAPAELHNDRLGSERENRSRLPLAGDRMGPGAGVTTRTNGSAAVTT